MSKSIVCGWNKLVILVFHSRFEGENDISMDIVLCMLKGFLAKRSIVSYFLFKITCEFLDEQRKGRGI